MSIGCNKNDIINPNTSSTHIVNIDVAKKLAVNYFNKIHKTTLVARNDFLVSSKTFTGANGLPGAHIINYDDGNSKRFVIIAGDNRIPPLLAYGEHEFLLDTMPYGIADWLNQQIKFIDSIRTTDLVQEDGIKEMWENDMIIPEEDNDCCPECPNYPDCLGPEVGCGANIDCNGDGNDDDDPCGHYNTELYGPLLDTEWGQGCVYNEYCPINTNCEWWMCDHSATGCVATATAQVINYFEFPNTYNYSILQTIYWPWDFNAPGADEIARLMHDIGESLDMDYGCSSSASTSDVNDILEDDYGYTYGGDYDDYTSSEPVKQNIRWGKPVIFDGCREKLTIIFTWKYKGCHAWVCDGYKSLTNKCYGLLYYHMNWGWNGLDNGWYSFNSWTPQIGNYQYNKKCFIKY